MSIKIKPLDSGITILSNKFNSNTLSFGMWLNVGSVNEKNYTGQLLFPGQKYKIRIG